MKYKQYIQQLIREELASITKPLKITYDLNLTKHASERKYRHAEFMIKNKDIIDLIDKSISKLTMELIQDNIDIGDEIVITDVDSNLNVVGILKHGKNQSEIRFIIKTIMIKQNFKTHTKHYYFK